MTLGELFIKIGFKPDTEQLSKIQSTVAQAASNMQTKAKGFKTAGDTISNGFKSLGTGILGFFGSLKSAGEKLGNFVLDLKRIHFLVIGIGAAFVGITKKASDYAAELLRVNSVTGISTQALQALQQQAAASGVEAEEVNSSLKDLQQKALEIQMGRGNAAPWALLGINPSTDPLQVLNQLSQKLSGMSAARGAMFARELGLSDKMISFVKEAKSLGSSDQSLLLSDKEIKKLKAFNIYFNKAWDGAKRSMQQLGVTLIPVATKIVDAFNRMVTATKDIAHFFEWFSSNFKGITKALLVFAGVIGVALFPLTAGFLALALAIEDVMTWFRGGDSITGRIIGPFKEWKEIIDSIVLSFKSMIEVITQLTTIQGWKDLFNGLVISGKEALGGLSNIKPLGASNADKYKAEDAKKGTVWEQIFGKNTPPTNDVTINVNGAQDPGVVAKKVVDEMNSNTMYQQPVGVK